MLLTGWHLKIKSYLKIKKLASALTWCLEKGYISRVDKLKEGQRRLHLPYFPVICKDKTTKLWVVFNAAAKTNWINLNGSIHQCPKLQTNFCAALTRFRKYPVALACDIAEMYSRTGRAPEDQGIIIFYGYMDRTKQPGIFESNSLVFGINSAPSEA